LKTGEKMDDRLTIKLIDDGYDSVNAEKITLSEAGEIIRKNIVTNFKDSCDALFIDGLIEADLNERFNNTTIVGYSTLITNKRLHSPRNYGLAIYTIPDFDKANVAEIFLCGDHHYKLIESQTDKYNPENVLRIFIPDYETGALTKRLKLSKNSETEVLHLKPIDELKKDELFWNYIGNRLNLKLNHYNSATQEVDSTKPNSWYEAKDEKSGIHLALWNTLRRNLAIKLTFPEQKTKDELNQLVNMFTDVVSIDGLPYQKTIAKAATSFEVRIDARTGSQVLEYLNRVLKRT
jgi:hypothetical protein